MKGGGYPIITKVIDEETYQIRVENNKRQIPRLDIAHDYVRFVGSTLIYTDASLRTVIPTNVPDTGGRTNILSIGTEVSIGIKPFVEAALPLLNKHEYCTREHAKTYNHIDRFLEYYSPENKTYLVWFCLRGEEVGQTVTREVFNRFIKNQLNN